MLRKGYFGGGTVAAALADSPFLRLRPETERRLTDGTEHFLGVLALEVQDGEEKTCTETFNPLYILLENGESSISFCEKVAFPHGVSRFRSYSRILYCIIGSRSCARKRFYSIIIF